MPSRKECLEEALSNLSRGNSVSLRNASRSLADFCRVTLSEIGLHHSGYGIIKDVSIQHRYRLVCGLDPELIPYSKLFQDIQKLRDKIEHTDNFTPSQQELKSLIDKTKTLDELLDKKVIPALVKLGNSPRQKFLEEWNAVEAMYDSIDWYPAWAIGNFDHIKGKVEEFYSIKDSLNDLNNEAIHEARIRLRDLLNELKLLLKQADFSLQEASLEHDFDVWRGK